MVGRGGVPPRSLSTGTIRYKAALNFCLQDPIGCLISRRSGCSELEIKARPAGETVADYAGAMRPDDLHNYRQAQPGSIGANRLAAPEALENIRLILHSYARPAVQNTKGP